MLVGIPPVYAVSLEYVPVGTGSISSVSSILYAKIENTGSEKVFIALPSGWQIDETVDNTRFSSYKAYSVLESGLWRIYGMPYDRTSLLGAWEASPYITGKVWTSKEPVTVQSVDIDGRTGWWLWPNERLIIDVELSIGGSGTIDPQYLEKKYPYVKVLKWEQEFILTISKSGFIHAPWIVEGAALSEASPAPYCDAKRLGSLGTRYHEDFRLEMVEVSAPKWYEWFTITNKLPLSSISLASTTLEYYPVPAEISKRETVEPVWKVSDISKIHSKIRYAYEWERDREIKGITLWRGATGLETIPKWYEWF
jgi:hypothetical protein